MNTNNSSSTSSGPSFLGLLTILFIALKLTNVITWTWFWVLSPIIFVGAVSLFILGALFILALF